MNKELDTEKIKENLFKGHSSLCKYIKKVTSLEDYTFTLIEIIKIYLISKVINILNEKFILLIITNIVMFYAPIEDKTDHFLFKAKMAVKQTFEGILGLLSCLIPKYEEPQKEKNPF